MTQNTMPLDCLPETSPGAPTIMSQVAAAAQDAIASEKELSTRVASANTGKARAELMRLVSNQNALEVKAALDRGTDPNFLAERLGELQSPLRLAAFEGWVGGVLLLLENGAVESLAHAQYRRDHPEAASRSDIDKNLRHQSGPWLHVTDNRAFALLMQTEVDPELRRRCARTAAKNAHNCFWLLSEGLFSLVEDWNKIELDTIGQMRALSAKERAGSVQAKVVRALWKQDHEWLTRNVESRWAAIVEADALELMAELARAGAPDPASWSAARSMPLWTLALASSSVRVARALGQVGELRENGLANAKTYEALSQAQNAPTLREASRQGVDLARVADADGNTPLHLACKGNNPSKSVAVELVKVFPAWMETKNKNGLDPAQLLMKNTSSWMREKREKLIAELQSVSMSRDLTQIKKAQNAQDRDAAKRKPKKKPGVENEAAKTEGEGEKSQASVGSSKKLPRRL